MLHLTGPQGEYKVKTDSMGRYMVQELVPGSYTVKVEAKGFKTYVSQRNLVVAGETSSLDVHLQVGAVSDTVTVEAGAVQIDTESTALTTPLDRPALSVASAAPATFRASSPWRLEWSAVAERTPRTMAPTRRSVAHQALRTCTSWMA